MGLKAIAASVLEFLRAELDDGWTSDVAADPGFGDNVTAQHSGPPGEDSHPLAGDQAIIVQADGAGRFVAVGYIDPLNQPLAAPGEKRLYSRDGDGATAAIVWLKSDAQAAITGTTIHLGDDPGEASIPRDDHVQTEFSRVKSELDAVKADLNALKAAISAAGVSPMDGGASFKSSVVGALAAWPAMAPASPGSTAADKIKGT